MWTKVLANDIKLNVLTNSLPTKGKLVYEYNPFRNYRLSSNKYYFKGQYLTLDELKDKYNIYIEDDCWKNLNGADSPVLYEKGLLVDFDTDELSFSINNPVHMIPLYSYDGSVNLIINDGVNTPKLINSRFSATGRNTYEIVDRKGDNDTNIYDLGDLFEIDTSLYKLVINIPKITYNGTTSGGNLKVGNYFFYFKLSDADGNETDFIGESGLVSIFIGFDTPSSIHTGTKNENSYKSVKFYLSNIDTAYSYVTVYYSRSTSELDENINTEYCSIDKKYPINNAGCCNILITGYELTFNITAEDINLNYNIVDAVTTSAQCQNMLFLGNVHKLDIPYNDLADISLRFLPYLKEENYNISMDRDYELSTIEKGYYDTKFIYNKTGYWGKELYRIGIVYIMPNGELTPVFNIRGCSNVTIETNGQYTDFPIFKDDGERQIISYNETDYRILNSETSNYENVKGVIRLIPTKDTNTIYSLNIKANSEVIDYLKGIVKGFFFVRLPRMPFVLALGITIGIDQVGYLPCIPTQGGVLELLSESLNNTYVETEDINDVNYISEGFLSRYTFKLKAKSSNLWSKIGSIALTAVGVVAVAAACVFTAGAGAAVVAAGAAATTAGGVAAGVAAVTTVATAVTGITSGIAAVAAVAGGVVAASVAATALVGGIQEVTHIANRALSKVTLKGRNTDIPSGYKRVEVDSSRKLSQEFTERIIIKDSTKVNVLAIICPDYEVNLAYFNLIFTGNTHRIETTITQGINLDTGYSYNYFSNDGRHFYIPEYSDYSGQLGYDFKIIGVPDNTKCVGIGDLKFRSRAGEAEEAWRYECIGDDYKSDYSKIEDNEEDSETLSNKKINTDIVRGAFGPYLAFNDTNNKFSPASTVNIYIPEYNESNMEQYMLIRMNDSSTFNAISERIAINNLNDYGDGNMLDSSTEYNFNIYRGDCYICQVSHRLNRNFCDPSTLYNDDIVDDETWKDNYDPENTEKYESINLGDVNAVKLGMWLTFRIRSNNNLNIRTLDGSYSDEAAATGHQRGFYPYLPMSTEGIYKVPESGIFNKGFSKHLSDRWNNELPDVPHIKNWFGTRIMYSDIHINDAYKNGYRTFRALHYRDYTREYGEIVKLVSLDSNLLCVFEHGVALIPVNERALAGEGSGGNIFINTSNVLPEHPKIISDMFGTQWADSVLKVPGISGDSPTYVYGVDTVAKKIWRTDGNQLICISDFKVQEFLNNNISLGERELTPILGVRNVKTLYNAYKRDVMFTFYDNTYGFEEKVWNLCWNELLEQFITFYSWVPSFMENINNVPFSFDRNTSKWLAKLGTSHKDSSFADGITLSNVVTNNYIDSVTKLVTDNFDYTYSYIDKQGDTVTKTRTVPEESRAKFIGVLSLSNRVLPDLQMFYTIDYSLERDNYQNYKNFEIKKIEDIVLENDAMFEGKSIPIYGLYFGSGSDEYTPIYYDDSGENVEVSDGNGDTFYTFASRYNPDAIISELYYRNRAGHSYADDDILKLSTTKITEYGNYTPTEWFKDVETMNDICSRLSPTTIVGNSPGYDINGNPINGCTYPCTTVGEIQNELYYNEDGEPYVHCIPLNWHWTMEVSEYKQYKSLKVYLDLPIFKNLQGKRVMLPKDEQVNPDKIVTLLNIKANITIQSSSSGTLSDDYYNMKAGYLSGTSLISAGYYESVVAIAPKWNVGLLSSDFWKHGQAGIIDITDDIYPTYWYGKQHPFEFEFVVVNDPSIHKIFTNLEIVANKALPESFHYEIVGESYDFAKDKANIYFRQEAMKALWLYNGADICYNRNFTTVQTKQLARSADFPHKYLTRQDTINDIEDYYIHATYPQNYDYRHLSGAEVVYYPNRQEFRVWNHALAVNLDDMDLDDSRSIIASNCQYLEDRWKVTINPIVVCYKNEYTQKVAGVSLINPVNSTWARRYGSSAKVPSLPIYNSPIPDTILAKGTFDVPDNTNIEDSDNSLYLLYDFTDDNCFDFSNWLDDINVYGYNFGSAQNRKEIDVKDKFVKVRIRYSGEDLAIIDFINTIYQISYS